MSEYTELQKELIGIAQGICPAGLGQGTAGNVSVRVEGGFLVTPSALPYPQCEPGDVVFVNMNGDFEGKRKPSSEWRFHRDIYASREDAHAILHAHSPSCTALACLHKTIPAFHYMIAIAGGDDIRCAPYATYGTQELSDNALQALAGRTACLLANHGMIAMGENLQQAFSTAREVEELAGIYSRVLQMGEPNTLSKEQMAEVLEKFEDYRKTNGVRERSV